jgi:Obg family GTPase CgtA
MQFFDRVTVKCTSGAGGDGCVSARREKYVPFWWPSGGNGGKGGSIILRGDVQLTTLGALHARKHIKAPAGESGKIKEQYGQDAEDVIFLVPVGTIVRDVVSNHVVAHIYEADQETVLLPGGKGGVGNMHFSNSITQYANFWLHGEPWQTREFEFELQLLADVALLWFPSVGKTSLLNAVSAAAAKTAEYHFTTLVPNLWVVTKVDPAFVLIDVPGLIAWAAGGKWLGNEFLRHVMKARLWSLVFDCSVYEQGIDMLVQLIDEIALYLETIVYAGKTITQELVREDEMMTWKVRDKDTKANLLTKQCIFLWNKVDLVTDPEIREELLTTMSTTIKANPLVKLTEKQIRKGVFLVSAWSSEGVDQRLQRSVHALQHAPVREFTWDEELVAEEKQIMRTRTQIDELSVTDVTPQWLQRLVDHDYLQEKDQKYVFVREISHPEMSYLTYVLPRGNDEAELWYRRVLEKKQILKHLERAWVKKGDVFLIKSPYAGKDDRWVRWV